MGRKGQKGYALALAAMLMFAAVLTAFLAIRTTAKAINLPNPLDFRGKSTHSNASYGYAWDADTKTLTLSNLSMQLNTAQDTALYLPAGSTIYLPEGTENEIVLPESVASTMSFYGIRCEGDLTIEGKGSLSVRLLQPRDRINGIDVAGSVTVKECTLSVEVATTPSYCFGIYATGKVLAKDGASVLAHASGVLANLPNAALACGVYAASLEVQNATVFGTVGASVNTGGGVLRAAGISVNTVSILESGAVTASNATGFSENTPALWGKVVLDGTSLLIENAQQALDADTSRYGQSDPEMPMSVGTKATFRAYEGKTYEGPEALTSPYSEYTFLGWFDEKGNPYKGELGKTYTAKWQKGNVPAFYGPLNLSNDAPSQSDSHFGYAWDSATKTLTLSGLCLYAPEGGVGLVLPAGATVVCTAGTTSDIRADGLSPSGINAGIYTEGNVTFKGQGTLYAKGGTVPPIGTVAACGIYGAFTLNGPTLYAQGGELDFYGSVGFFAPADAAVTYEAGSLHAYGKGRAGMLGTNATFTAPQRATLKAGDESADLLIETFMRSCAQKYFSVTLPQQTGNQSNRPQDSDKPFAGEILHILLLLLFIFVSVGVIAFLGSRKKKKAPKSAPEEPSAQNEDENAE